MFGARARLLLPAAFATLALLLGLCAPTGVALAEDGPDRPGAAATAPFAGHHAARTAPEITPPSWPADQHAGKTSPASAALPAALLTAALHAWSRARRRPRALPRAPGLPGRGSRAPPRHPGTP